MKVKGKSLVAPKPKHVALVRDEGNIVLTCGPVLDYTRFDQICPEPQAPLVKPVDGVPYRDEKDPKYLKRREQYFEHRQTWLFLASLAATEGLEWETVKEDDPETWKNWEKELSTVATQAEIMQIKSAIITANMTTEETQKEAIQAFFRQAEEASKAHRLLETGGASSTVFGEPANA